MLNEERVLNGIHFDIVQRNWHDSVGNCQDEYDIVMRNGSSIFILESKFKASKSDVEKLLTTKQENFNILFPEYKNYDQHWGLAATIIDEELKDMDRAAIQRRLIGHSPQEMSPSDFRGGADD